MTQTPSQQPERAGKERISPPKQQQSEPGLDLKMQPKADHGEGSYQGRERLTGKRLYLGILPRPGHRAGDAVVDGENRDLLG